MVKSRPPKRSRTSMAKTKREVAQLQRLVKSLQEKLGSASKGVTYALKSDVCKHQSGHKSDQFRLYRKFAI